MEAKPGLPEERSEALGETASLQARFGHAAPGAIIRAAICDLFSGDIAAVSSFGADSAVLLHMISEVDRHLPILFLDTGQHFDETLDYRDALVADLGLTDVRITAPESLALAEADPQNRLYETDTEACCAVRKVEPMARAVSPFRAWFTGRKRFQATTRAALPVFEQIGPRVRINPLASWGADDLAAYMRDHALRPNPLVPYGYLSIGCFPCTRAVQPGEDARAGRWSGQAKTECGIHLGGLDRSLTGAGR